MGNLYVLKTFYHLDDVVLISCKYWCCVYTRHKRKYWEYYVCILLLNHIRRQLHLRFSRQPEANTRPKTTRATHTLIHISIHSEFVYLPRSINANAVSICLTWLYVCVCVCDFDMLSAFLRTSWAIFSCTTDWNVCFVLVFRVGAAAFASTE